MKRYKAHNIMKVKKNHFQINACGKSLHTPAIRIDVVVVDTFHFGQLLHCRNTHAYIPCTRKMHLAAAFHFKCHIHRPVFVVGQGKEWKTKSYNN